MLRLKANQEVQYCYCMQTKSSNAVQRTYASGILDQFSFQITVGLIYCNLTNFELCWDASGYSWQLCAGNHTAHVGTLNCMEQLFSFLWVIFWWRTGGGGEGLEEKQQQTEFTRWCVWYLNQFFHLFFFSFRLLEMDSKSLKSIQENSHPSWKGSNASLQSDSSNTSNLSNYASNNGDTPEPMSVQDQWLIWGKIVNDWEEYSRRKAKPLKVSSYYCTPRMANCLGFFWMSQLGISLSG